MPSHSFVQGSALSLLFAAAAYAQNCVLTVPPNPLTAQGLATPYTVTGCNQRDFAAQGSFVEAAIFDPATNSFSIYHPLVVNQGDVAGKNFIAPVTPTVPAGSVVGIWFGSNGLTLTLTGSGAGRCVNGFGGSIFGQFAHCNGDVFMQTTQAAINSGALVPPPVGTAANGNNVGQCLTTRDFRMVDMDQSDNVCTVYLLINNQILAQDTPANARNSTNVQDLANGSDNALLTAFLDPAFGCTPWMAPSLTAASGMAPSLALNELLAFKNPQTPANGGVALVPLNDDMTVINNGNTVTQSLGKTNAYRAGVGQTPAATTADASGITYCQNFAISGIFIADNQGTLAGKTSPMPAVANNLFTFMAQRFATSFGPVPALGCNNTFGIANPVTLTMNGQGVVTAATINTNVLQQVFNGQIKPKAAGTAAAGGTAGTGTAGTGTRTSAAGGSTASATEPATHAVNSAMATKVFGSPGHGRGHYRREHARDVRRDASAADSMG